LGSLKQSWHNDLISALNLSGIGYEVVSDKGYQSVSYDLISLVNGKVLLNLMDLKNPIVFNESVALQDAYALKNIQLIQLWEDVWLTRKEQVLARLQSIAGLNSKLHARKTEVVTITQQMADEFLNENHLQYSVGAKYRYALSANNVLVAVASFSGLRRMHNRIENYRSAELIRFANLRGTTVIGGFTKLLSHFMKCHNPNDIMSYADKDWSKGSAYEKAGFTLVETTPPAVIFVNKNTLKRTFPHRIDHQSEDLYTTVYNTGNLKFILTRE
jgi:hypothetical protein